MEDKNEKSRVVISAGIGYKTQADFFPTNCIAQRPYKDKGVVGRIFREVWFRAGLPERIWYKPVCTGGEIESISVQDSLITRNYLAWLLKQYPDAHISYDYCNLVGTSRHLLPQQVPEEIDLTTYDKGDSEKYGMFLREGGEFLERHIIEKQPIEYDIFYVGADKGRGEYLLSLKSEFDKMGLRTKFIITPEKRFVIPKKYHSKKISYHEVLEYDSKSRAILNVVLPGQLGATKRDFEALFLKAKLITNNKHIKEYDFYKKENVFILGEDDMVTLPKFVMSEWQEVEKEVLERHLIRNV